MSDYLVPASTTIFETVVKKSRFVACISHAPGRVDAVSYIEQINHSHSDARHVCWAYIAGEPGNTTDIACSDAGEPGGTAGKPMLTVLRHSELGEVVAVVVRYFGGVKLGASGLVRAYSNAVSTALAITPLSRRRTTVSITLNLPFAMENLVRHCLDKHGASILNSEYKNDLTLVCAVADSNRQVLQDMLTDRSNGEISCKIGETAPRS